MVSIEYVSVTKSLLNFPNEDELITTSLRYDLKLSLKDSISYEQVGRITIEQNGMNIICNHICKNKT